MSIDNARQEYGATEWHDLAPSPKPAEQEKKSLSTPGPKYPLSFLATPALGLLFLLGGLGFVMGRVSQPAETTAAEQSVAAPACQSYSSLVDDVRILVGQGQLEAAVSWADLYLGDQQKQLCSGTREALARLRYQSARSLALTVPDRETPYANETAIRRLQEAEEKAAAQRLSPEQRISPMTLFGEASDRSLWEVARFAFLEAWDAKLVGQHDIQAISRYFATLRNLGGELARHDRHDSKARGLVILRTADEISRTYLLRRGEAQQDLVDFLGTDRARWPAPLTEDPVLNVKLRQEAGP